MEKNLTILGDGQVWDLRCISPTAPQSTFEDLFSGRALGCLAQEADILSLTGTNVFSLFKDKNRITGLSVTKALLSKNQKARRAAVLVLDELAYNGALGIRALQTGIGCKPRWSGSERRNWKGLETVIIGGGVSEQETGRLLVRLLKKHLADLRLSRIRVLQAPFPGKEAGFMGAVISTMQEIRREARIRRLDVIGGIGLDVGRDEIGVGLVAIRSRDGSIVRHRGNYWVFRASLKMPCRSQLKRFLDERRDYTEAERRTGERIRRLLLERMAHLAASAHRYAQAHGLHSSCSIGVAVPGAVSGDGFILNSTDYLPFLRRRDGFHFSRSLVETLQKKGLGACAVYLVNDGIAAGIANVHIKLSAVRSGKVAFFGVGSGLGGCVGRVNVQ